MVSEANQMVTFLKANDNVVYGSDKIQAVESGCLRPKYRFRKFDGVLAPQRSVLPSYQRERHLRTLANGPTLIAKEP